MPSRARPGCGSGARRPRTLPLECSASPAVVWLRFADHHRGETRMKTGRLLLGVAAAAFACTVSAQDRRPEYGTPITITQAKHYAAGVLAECAKNSWNVAVAIVDPHGSLVYFERMENTQYA